MRRRFAWMALAIALAAPLAGPAGGVPETPDPSRLLLYHLLDLDQRELFPAGGYNPLAEMEAWSDLYVALRDKAQNDTTEDNRFLKSFMLMGWIAHARNDFAIIESFNTDFMSLFERRTDRVLGVMAAQEFLATDMCVYLAKFFFFEDRDPAGRQPWIEGFKLRVEQVLGADGAQRCLDAFRQVTE